MARPPLPAAGGSRGPLFVISLISGAAQQFVLAGWTQQGNWRCLRFQRVTRGRFQQAEGQ